MINDKSTEDLINQCINGYKFSFEEARDLLNFDLNILGLIADELKNNKEIIR